MAQPTATGIAGAPHLTALADSFNAVLQGIDISPILIYVIDTCPASALYDLADQLDMLGYKGWASAETEEERRDLLRGAIELHRRKGTPWSIKQALLQLGYSSVTILEGAGAAPAGYSGAYLHDGSIKYDSAAYADPFWFSVTIDLQGGGAPTAEQELAVEKTINEYKNARSRLASVTYLNP